MITKKTIPILKLQNFHRVEKQNPILFNKFSLHTQTCFFPLSTSLSKTNMSFYTDQGSILFIPLFKPLLSAHYFAAKRKAFRVGFMLQNWLFQRCFFSMFIAVSIGQQ